MDSIRTEPLAKEEKAELTALLAMLQSTTSKRQDNPALQ